MRCTRRQAVLALVSTVAGACAAPSAPRPAEQPTPQPTPTPRASPVVTVALTPVASTPSSPTPEPAPRATPTAAPTTLTGIDVLLRDRTELLRGQRIGLVTNPTGRDRQGRSTIDVLFAEKSWRLAALFSPEHGIRGDAAAGQSVDSATDPQTGLPVLSLYGATTRPTANMLRGLDVLVYDIQDVGARVYTYTSTLLDILRAGAEHGLPVVVLDRPNPIGGVQVEGTVLDPRFTSFVGAAPIAMRYGMTIGELGRYFNAELEVGAELSVVRLQNWRRTDWFDQTGLTWVNPSPNLRSLSAATLYPGTVLFEGTTFSEGRGTDAPFEWIGDPSIDGQAWAAHLNEAALPGVRFSAAARTPGASKHAQELCQGVQISIADRHQVRPMEVAITMLALARPRFLDATFDHLAGTDQVRAALQAGASPVDIAASWQADLERFQAVRRRYLLY